MGWISNWPLSGTPVSGSPDQKQDNFEIIEDWWDVEHFTFTSGNSGEHLPGRVAALYYGTQTQIDSLVSPGTGSLAYATDKGTLELYRGSWERLTENYFSRVRNIATSMTIPTSVWTPITTWESSSASGMYDTLDEWSSSKFTARAAGYYLVIFHASWVYSAAAYQRAIGLFKNGILTTISRRFGSISMYNNACDIVSLNASDYLQLSAWHNHASDKTLNAANISIQRIS
jgi:hypothetical protein